MDIPVINKDKTIIMQKYDCKKEDPNLQIGHDQVSKTDKIFLTKVVHKGTLYIVDTPGFNETRGLEIEISNFILINKAIKIANSVKLIILINYHQLKTDRGDSLRKLLKTVS